MTNKLRWQAPGNGEFFDTSFKDWQQDNKVMSKRTIGLLQYLKSKNITNITEYENEINDYLKRKYNNEINNSNKRHFYRPLEFFGLIKSDKNNLSLSIDGKNFLYQIEQENFIEAKHFLLRQMMRTKYPNNATKDIKLHLYPFQIMFKLLLERGKITRDDFETKLPYINNIQDINNFDNLMGDRYEKWHSWVIKCLVKMEILQCINNNEYIIVNDCRDFIQQLLENVEYKDMFFEKEQSEIINSQQFIKNIHKYKRDPQIRQEALKKANYKCFFDNNHITFPTSNYEIYMEGHHIIPVSRKESFIQELDVVENILCLCPTCHRKIHLSTNEVKENMLKEIIKNTKIDTIFNINILNLQEIYFN